MPGMKSTGISEMIVVACWYLWWLRRQFTHEGIVHQLGRSAVSILVITANAANHPNMQVAEADLRWRKPEIRTVKLNVDDAFDVDQGTGGTTADIRDHKGRFMVAQCSYVPFAADSSTTEAMAMRDGLILVNSLGCNIVEAKSYSMEVINFCSGSSQWWDSAAASRR